MKLKCTFEKQALTLSAAPQSERSQEFVLTFANRIGIDGAKGDQGDRGEQGAQGIQGTRGEQGDQGIPGATGNRGEQGIQGIQGIQGTRGEQGVQGPKGDTGETGEVGTKGDKGDVGGVGETGKSAYELAVIGGYIGTLEQFATEAAELANNSARLTSTEAHIGRLTEAMPHKADLDPATQTVAPAQIAPLQGLQTGVDCASGWYNKQLNVADLHQFTAEIYISQREINLNSAQLVYRVSATSNPFAVRITSGNYLAVYLGNEAVYLTPLLRKDYHIVISIDYALQAAMLFINGVFMGKYQSSTQLLPISHQYIGGYSSVDAYKSGVIRKIRLFNYALSDAECMALYNSGDPLNYMLPTHMKNVDVSKVFVPDFTRANSVTVGWMSTQLDTVTARSANGIVLNCGSVAVSGRPAIWANYLFRPNHAYKIKVSFSLISGDVRVFQYGNPVTNLTEVTGLPYITTLGDYMWESPVLVVPQILPTTYSIPYVYFSNSIPNSEFKITGLEVVEVGCIAEYLPCGLLPDKWRDTSGSGNDIAAVGAPQLVYQRQAYITVDKGLRALFVARGAVWNERTGFYELNGLADITEAEMIRIWTLSGHLMPLWWSNYFSDPKYRNNVRTLFPFNSQYGGSYASAYNTFASMYSLEVLAITLNMTGFSTISGIFINCKNLTTIIGGLDLRGCTAAGNANGFGGCAKLENINIKALSISMTIKDSPNLTRDSILYLINNATNATNATPITVTLHATAASRLTPEDIALASSKNITIA